MRQSFILTSLYDKVSWSKLCVMFVAVCVCVLCHASNHVPFTALGDGEEGAADFNILQYQITSNVAAAGAIATADDFAVRGGDLGSLQC